MTDLVKEDCSPGAVEHVLQESECDKIGLVHDGEPVTRCRSAQKEEELSGHTGPACRRPRVGGYLSRCSDSAWIWSRRKGLHVHAWVSSASYYLQSWPGRWSWARPAALAGKSTVLRKIALSGRVILPVQEVAANPWCTEREHLRSGTCSEERRAKWAHVGLSPWHRCASKIDGPCTGRPHSSSDSEQEHCGSGTSARLGATAGVC